MKVPWTKEEDEILATYYAKEGTQTANRLQGRTLNAVKNRAQALGLTYRKTLATWTTEELKILKEYYPIEGKQIAERLPGRTLKTIQVTAYRLGIKRRNKEAE